MPCILYVNVSFRKSLMESQCRPHVDGLPCFECEYKLFFVSICGLTVDW